MSAILDALRQHQADAGAPAATSGADAVLATLSRGRGQQKGSVSLKMLLVYGASAVVIGFVALSGLIYFLAPSTAPRPAAQVAATNRPAPAPPTPVATPTPVGDSEKVALRPASVAAPRQTSPQPPPPDVVPRRPAPQRPSPPPAPTRPVEPAPVIARPPDPTPPAPNHFALALYNQRIGNYAEALAHYNALLAQNDSAEVHNNIGLINIELGRFDDAVRECQRAIGIDPKYVKAHNNLGVAFMRLNRVADAGAEFRVALTIDERNVESIVNLALLQKAAGRPAEARDLLRRAVAIDPGSAGSHYNLAVIADETGDRVSALEHYRAFLKYGSVTHGELVAAVRARLAALTG